MKDMNALAIWFILVWCTAMAALFAIGGTVTHLPAGIMAMIKGLGL